MNKNSLILLFCFVTILSNFSFAGDIELWKNSGPIKANGNSLSLYNKGDEIFLQGKTEISRTDFLIKADKSRIFQKTKGIKSFGNVFAKRIFDSGNYLEAFSNNIFYTDESKILEMFIVKDLNYFLQKENKIINLKSEYLKIDETKEIRTANVKNMTSFTMPFEEIKEDGKKITGLDFIRSEKLKATGAISAQDFDYVELNKKVFFDRKKSDNDHYTLKCDNLVYDKKVKITTINDIEEATYFSGKDKIKYFLTAKKVVWNMTDDNSDVIEIFGNPIVFRREDDGYIIKANKAVYYKKDGRVWFTQNPILLQNDKDGKGIYKAENIYYFMETKLLKFEKNVNIEFVPRKKKEEKKEIQKPAEKNIKKGKKDKKDAAKS